MWSEPANYRENQDKGWQPSLLLPYGCADVMEVMEKAVNGYLLIVALFTPHTQQHLHSLCSVPPTSSSVHIFPTPFPKGSDLTPAQQMKEALPTPSSIGWIHKGAGIALWIILPSPLSCYFSPICSSPGVINDSQSALDCFRKFLYPGKPLGLRQTSRMIGYLALPDLISIFL